MLYIEVIPMQDESESKKLTKQLYHYVQKKFYLMDCSAIFIRSDK